MREQLRRVFKRKADMFASYAAVFRRTGPTAGAAGIVLDDIAAFCRADRTTFSAEARDEILIMEGRRQVWLHLQSRLQLNGQQLDALRRELRETDDE
ncbi:MAG: hypothetical protein ACOY5R_06595 [Pseudomonadota bacterium]